MEKFKSQIGTITFLLFLVTTILDVGLLMVWGITGIWIPFLIFSVLYIVFVIPPFFLTQYYLTQDYLKITSLWLYWGVKIKYENIVCVVPTTSFKISAKLSSECIKIVYLKNGKTKEVYVSPALYDRFINLLTDNVLYNSVLKDKQSNKTFMENEEKYKAKKEEEKALKDLQEQKKIAKQTKPQQKKETSKTKTQNKTIK